jgi:hypothetical protein
VFKLKYFVNFSPGSILKVLITLVFLIFSSIVSLIPVLFVKIITGRIVISIVTDSFKYIE